MCTDVPTDVMWINTMCVVSVLVILHTLCLSIQHLWGRQCTSLWRGTEFLKAELCFHRFANSDSVPIYIFGFHHKQCASNSSIINEGFDTLLKNIFLHKRNHKHSYRDS